MCVCDCGKIAKIERSIAPDARDDDGLIDSYGRDAKSLKICPVEAWILYVIYEKPYKAITSFYLNLPDFCQTWKVGNAARGGSINQKGAICQCADRFRKLWLFRKWKATMGCPSVCLCVSWQSSAEEKPWKRGLQQVNVTFLHLRRIPFRLPPSSIDGGGEVAARRHRHKSIEASSGVAAIEGSGRTWCVENPSVPWARAREFARRGWFHFYPLAGATVGVAHFPWISSSCLFWFRYFLNNWWLWEALAKKKNTENENKSSWASYS